MYCDPDAERIAETASSSSSSLISSLGKKHNSSSAANSTYKKIDGGSSDTNGATKKIDNRSSTSSSNNAAAFEELTAAPREGCIEVRKMRLRIRLFAQHKPWDTTPNAATTTSSTCSASKRGISMSANASQSGGGDTNNKALISKVSPVPGVDVGTVDYKSSTKNKDDHEDGYDTETPGSDGWNNNALIVRRRNTLLVTTRRGWGALVFQFKSVRDCIDFCDRLVYLNRNLLMPQRLPLATSSFNTRSANEEVNKNDHLVDNDTNLYKKRKYVNGLDQREQYIAELNDIKRCKMAMLGDQEVIAPKYDTSLRIHKFSTRSGSGVNIDKSDTTRMNGIKAPGISEEQASKYRRESIMNYIVQLAHSEEFRGFVDEFERGLISSSFAPEAL